MSNYLYDLPDETKKILKIERHEHVGVSEIYIRNVKNKQLLINFDIDLHTDIQICYNNHGEKLIESCPLNNIHGWFKMKPLHDLITIKFSTETEDMMRIEYIVLPEKFYNLNITDFI